MLAKKAFEYMCGEFRCTVYKHEIIFQKLFRYFLGEVEDLVDRFTQPSHLLQS